MPLLSKFVVFCLVGDAGTFAAPLDKVPRVKVFTGSESGEQVQLGDFGISFNCRIPSVATPPSPGASFRLLGVAPEFEIGLHGVTVEDHEQGANGREFIARSTLRINTGWKFIEVYPNVELRHWTKENTDLPSGYWRWTSRGRVRRCRRLKGSCAL